MNEASGCDPSLKHGHTGIFLSLSEHLVEPRLLIRCSIIKRDPDLDLGSFSGGSVTKNICHQQVAHNCVYVCVFFPCHSRLVRSCAVSAHGLQRAPCGSTFNTLRINAETGPLRVLDL